MKQYLTPLLADAVPGSVRTPGVHAPEYAQQVSWDTAHTHSGSSPSPPVAVHESRESLASGRHSAALRERLTQTRARIARAHAEHPPQIHVDWDPEEPPTRHYQGRALPSPRALAAARAHHPSPQVFHPEEHVSAGVSKTFVRGPLQARGSHMRTHARGRTDHDHDHDHDDSSSTLPPSLTAQLPPHVEPAPHIAPLSDRPSLAPRTGRERGSLWARLSQQLGRDRSDAGLRTRMAYCALALLVVAASSRMLFGGHTGARVLLRLVPADARVSLDGQALSGATNPHVLKGIAPGEHELLVEKAGFVAQRHKLTLAAGELERPLTLTLKLAPALHNADVSISSDPPGALIFLNGQTSSLVTPAKLTALAPGRHLISLKLAGYADAKEALSLPHDALVSIKLLSLSEPRFVEDQAGSRSPTRAEQRAQARALARERRVAARAAKVLLRYRARMGLPPDPVAQELVDAYAPVQAAE